MTKYQLIDEPTKLQQAYGDSQQKEIDTLKQMVEWMLETMAAEDGSSTCVVAYTLALLAPTEESRDYLREVARKYSK